MQRPNTQGPALTTSDPLMNTSFQMISTESKAKAVMTQGQLADMRAKNVTSFLATREMVFDHTYSGRLVT